ncbi:MAG TPA: hypothetical protein VMC86_00035 [Gemmatimonadales bacterium]|nr:hypothetical protein [Gemmatimonadales bacterium]
MIRSVLFLFALLLVVGGAVAAENECQMLPPGSLSRQECEHRARQVGVSLIMITGIAPS